MFVMIASSRPRAFCRNNRSLGHDRVEPRGNAIAANEQASGTAKIDPLMAALDAVALMVMNSRAGRQSHLPTNELLVV